MTSFRGEGGAFVPYIIPKEFTFFENYRQLLANDSGSYPFVRWFLNTLFVLLSAAVFCPHLLQSQWPTLSRLRFRLRKPFLKVALVLNMFPRLYEHDRRLLYSKSPQPNTKAY